jgi:hypothetical protein
MGAKTKKHVWDKRRQLAKAVLEAKQLNPDYERELEGGISRFRQAALEQSRLPGFPDIVAAQYAEFTPEQWAEAFSLTPEGAALQNKYGLSFDVPAFEHAVALAETTEEFLFFNSQRPSSSRLSSQH